MLIKVENPETNGKSMNEEKLPAFVAELRISLEVELKEILMASIDDKKTAKNTIKNTESSSSGVTYAKIVTSNSNQEKSYPDFRVLMIATKKMNSRKPSDSHVFFTMVYGPWVVILTQSR